MMITLFANAATNGQIQMVMEGCDHNFARHCFEQLIQAIDAHNAQQNAQGNGQPPPARRPSGLIVPPTAIPRDALNPNQQQPPT